MRKIYNVGRYMILNITDMRKTQSQLPPRFGMPSRGPRPLPVLTVFLIFLLSTAVFAQQKPVTGYAPVNGLKMYYEIRGSGEPVVLLHGAFMTISDDNWSVLIDELAKTHKVIAVEMQGHGRTADIDRDITYENLSDDVAGLLNYLKIERADVVGYSLGGGVAIDTAIRHPEKVRKVVSISAPIRRDGWVKEANDFWPNFTWEIFKGTPMEAEYKRLSPTPDKFPDFVNHIKATALRPYDFGADKLKATKAPIFFIHGDADGVRLDHIAEMYGLKGGGNIHGDMQPRSESRLAIIPNTTHVTLMNRMSTIVPMINDFLDAKIQK
jgi:pimeloyl-ACP methyl ester carboxylesterase